jgi:signal recognition particle subunit SRP68
VLKITKSYQQQHGLRHGDYQRYRHFCSRRLQRIRRVIKFTNGKKQFIKKVVTAEVAVSVGYAACDIASS